MLKGNPNTQIPRDLLPYPSPLRCNSSPAKLLEVSHILQKLYYKLSPSSSVFTPMLRCIKDNQKSNTVRQLFYMLFPCTLHI